MAQGTSNKPAADKGAAPEVANEVPEHGDHDRVQMLSLKADGTPDQHNPEMIGDPEASLAATTEQFVQQAVSAADVQANPGGKTMLVGVGEDGEVEERPASEAPQDPSIAETQEEHAKVAEAAKDAAVKAVEALHTEGAPSDTEAAQAGTKVVKPDDTASKG